MTPARFAVLAEAYGADLARWPVAERATAQRLLSQTPAAAELLTEAGRLDDALACYRIEDPSTDLQRRIATALLRRRGVRARFGRWLSGLGAVGVLGAGAAAGAAVVALVGVSVPLHSDLEGLGSLYEQSGFGDVVPVDDAPAPSART